MKKRPTLFLDRDGVINRRTPGDYVKDPAVFVPHLGALEAIQHLASRFGRILVVTNQAGIGKGLMTVSDLEAVHRKMLAQVQATGGRIDGIYYCPHTPAEGCACRKPANGMALQARADFPEIDFAHSWMVGDSLTDLQFGQSLGMRTVLINGKFEERDLLARFPADHRFDSLLDFAAYAEEQGIC